MRLLSTALLLGLAICAAEGARANPIPINVAGTHPVPRSRVRVALVKEDLRIDLGFERVTVEAQLHFKNSGKAVRSHMGLPCSWRRDASWSDHLANFTCHMPIKVWIRGQRAKTRAVRTGKLRGHVVWPVIYSTRSTTPVTIRYTTPLIQSPGRRGTRIGGLAAVYYQLRTGARWAGSIEELNIQLRTPTETILHIQPGGHVRKPGLITWRWRQWEPDEDLVIMLSWRNTERYFSLFKKKDRRTVDDLHRARDSGAFDRDGLVRLIKRFEAESKNTWTTLAFSKLLKRAHGLSIPTKASIIRCIQESARVMQGLLQSEQARQQGRAGEGT